MKTTIFLSVLFPLLFSSLSSAAPLVSTQGERRSVDVTVYQGGLALVKERRDVALPAGKSELRFVDVPSSIIPASVRVTGGGKELRVLEQSYDYDILSPEKLLERYVGKEVRLYQKNPYTEREEEVTATLLSTAGSSPLFRIGSGITFNHPGRIIFPKLPDDLSPRPTLSWLLESSVEGKRPLEVAYLTEGMTWRADYILVLDAKEKIGDLECRVTIDNKSGGSFEGARVKLVAGELNRAQEVRRFQPMAAGMYAAAPAPAPAREESFSEYHLYTLNLPLDLKDRQDKQVSLFSASAVSVTKEFILKGTITPYYGRMETEKRRVAVVAEMENREQNHLGMPLPKGTVRVYSRDSGGNLLYAGEDTIEAVPHNEKLRVKLGESFDIVAERRQTDWKRITQDTVEAALEIRIRNHSSEAVTVRVIEPVPGDWQVLEASQKWQKGDASALEFSLPVPKGGESVVTYRIRSRM